MHLDHDEIDDMLRAARPRPIPRRRLDDALPGLLLGALTLCSLALIAAAVWTWA